MSRRTLVMGDIHGNLSALNQCLERSQFDNEFGYPDTLGDIGNLTRG